VTLRSMTGFGRAAYQQNGFAFEILMKGSNSRFAEFNFKLPPLLSACEQEFRSILQKTVRRGKVTLTVNGNFEVMNRTRLFCDGQAVQNYLAICRSLGLPTHGAHGMTAKWEALRIPGVLKVGGIEEIDPKGRRLLHRLLQKCLQTFLRFKQSEGKKIQLELLRKSRRLALLARRMEGGCRQVKQATEKQIRDLADRYCRDSEALRDRIGFEIAAALDRLDVSEECARLKFHISEYQSALLSASPALGRKLDFLLQEMHREINTMGAKGRDAALSRWVVQAKDIVEQMREQVQNVE